MEIAITVEFVKHKKREQRMKIEKAKRMARQEFEEKKIKTEEN